MFELRYVPIRRSWHFGCNRDSCNTNTKIRMLFGKKNTLLRGWHRVFCFDLFCFVFFCLTHTAAENDLNCKPKNSSVLVPRDRPTKELTIFGKQMFSCTEKKRTFILVLVCLRLLGGDCLFACLFDCLWFVLT